MSLPPHLHVGIAEIATRLGVSRQRVHQIRATYPDFPTPADELARGPIWHDNDISAWIAAHADRPSGHRRQAPPAKP